MITGTCKIMWKTKTIISPLTRCLWPQNFVGWWLNWRAPNHKVIQCSNHMILQSCLTNKNHYISTTRVPMATKLGRMVICLDRLLPIESHGLLIMWSCEITWQTKTISPLPQCLWLLKLIGWWYTLRGT